MSIISYPTDKLLAYAYAIYRINGGYIKQTQRFSEDKPTRWSNKEAVAFTAATEFVSDSPFQTWVPPEFTPIEVTDADLENVEIAKKHFRRYTLLSLGDDLSQFQKDIFASICKEENSPKQIGLLAYVPAFVEREMENIFYKRRIKTEFSDSEHIREPLVKQTVEILKKVPMPNYATNLYVGVVNGNLVSFSKSDSLDTALYTINARIKGPDSERETRLPLTRLNYVKLKKVN